MSIQLDLDHPALFREVDRGNLLAWIDGMPAQLESAYRAGLTFSLPEKKPYHAVVLSGVGDSILAGDLFAAYAAAVCSVPVFIQRDYDLPAWANDEQVLVVGLALDGDAEETLSALEAARARGCRAAVFTRGRPLADLAEKTNIPLWRIDYDGPARCSVGWFFGMLLALFFRLGLIPDPARDLMATIEAMQAQQAQISAEAPTRQNSAKRLAGQVVDRWVSVLGSGPLAVVARRWKNQIAETAKAWAQWDVLPEADYNTVEGVNNPADLVPHAYAIFLHGAGDHPRNQLRTQLTQRALMLEGIPTDIISARGASVLEQIWTALHYGDYFSYYLAMIYQVDPGPLDRIQNIQADMAES